MTTDQVTVEKADRIAMVRFDRGDHANSLSIAIMRELTAVAHDLADDPDLCAVVLTGRVDNFCLGLDLKDGEVAKIAAAGLAERRVMLKTGPVCPDPKFGRLRRGLAGLPGKKSPRLYRSIDRTVCQNH